MLDVYVESSDVNNFISFLDQFRTGDMTGKAFKKLADEVREELIQNSPVGDEAIDEHPGQLKQSWQRPVITRMGDEWKATITNTAPYSAAVNNGHYQEVGRYVPAINARLVHYYVPGLYFAENTIDQMGLKSNSILSSEYLRQWKSIRTNYYDEAGEKLAGLIE